MQADSRGLFGGIGLSCVPISKSGISPAGAAFGSPALFTE